MAIPDADADSECTSVIDIRDNISDKQISTISPIDLRTECDDQVPVISNNTPTYRGTFPILTKYEKTLILGVRVQQLTNGSSSTLDQSSIASMSAYEIALEELHRGAIPFKVKRTLPNGNTETWDISELLIM